MRLVVAACVLTACSGAPPAAAPPQQATMLSARSVRTQTAVCQDGTLSYSRTRQGTCSQHGGVREWGR
jgi:hypothetical protein